MPGDWTVLMPGLSHFKLPKLFIKNNANFYKIKKNIMVLGNLVDFWGIFCYSGRDFGV